MNDYIMFACIFCCGVLFGNFEGDQATFRDCAMSGEAKMAGGGVIRCGIKEKST